MSKLQQKLEKMYGEILNMMYGESKPKINFQELIENRKTKEEGFFMHYYLPKNDYNLIIEKYLEDKKINTKLKTDIHVNLALGASPTQVDFYYKLTRLNDGLERISERVRWIEFKKNDTFKDWFHNIAIGRSLFMSPFNRFFTWQTTPVTEIIEDDYAWGAHFKTKNSEYKLERVLKSEG